MDLSPMGGKLAWKRTFRYISIVLTYFLCSCDIVIGGITTETSTSDFQGYNTTRSRELSDILKEESRAQIGFEETSEVEPNRSQTELRAINTNIPFSLLGRSLESNLQSNYQTEETKRLQQEPRELSITERLGTELDEITGTTNQNSVFASNENAVESSTFYFNSSFQNLLPTKVEAAPTAADESSKLTLKDIEILVDDVTNDHNGVQSKRQSRTSELQRPSQDLVTQPVKRSQAELNATESWNDKRITEDSNLTESVTAGIAMTYVVHEAEVDRSTKIESAQQQRGAFHVQHMTVKNRLTGKPWPFSRNFSTFAAVHSGISTDLETSPPTGNQSTQSLNGYDSYYESETSTFSNWPIEEQRRRASGSEPPWRLIGRRRDGVRSPDTFGTWPSTTSGEQPPFMQTSFDWNEDGGLLGNSTTEGTSESGVSLSTLVSMVVTGVVLGLICVATVVGNLLVLLAVSLHPHLRGTTHYFVANLAGADLLLGATVLPFSASLEVVKHWSFGQLLCDAWAAMDVLCCTASILSLCVISVDRYIGVTRPLQHSTILNERRVAYIILGIWVLSVTISIAPLFGWKEPPSGDPYTCEVTKQTGYVLFSVAGSFYIPLLVILVVYYRVYKEASARSRFLATGMKTSRSKHEQDTSCEVVLRIHTGRPLPSNGSTPDPPFRVSSIRGKYRSRRGVSTDRIGSSKGNPRRKVDPSDHRTHDRNPSCTARHNDGRLHSAFLHQPSSTVGRSRHGQLPSSPLSRSRHDDPAESGHRPVGIQSLASKIAKFNREKKAAKTLGIVVGVFIICWFPFFFVLPLEALCSSCSVPEGLFKVMFWLGYCNSLMNPIIYSCASQDFQLAFVRLLRCRCRTRRRPVTPLATTGPRYLYHDVPAPVYLRRPQHNPPGRPSGAPPAQTHPGRVSTLQQRGSDDSHASTTQTSLQRSEGDFGRERARCSLIDRSRTLKREHQTHREPERVWTSMRSRQITMI